MSSNQGIYKITCAKTGDFYIGSSCNIKVRWATHKWEMRKGKKKMLFGDLVGIHTVEAFTFEVVEEVTERHNLLEREQYWIDKTAPSLNLSMSASCSLRDPKYLGEGHPQAKHTRDEYLSIVECILANPEMTDTQILKALPFISTKSVVKHLRSGNNHKWLHEQEPTLAEKLEQLNRKRLAVWNREHYIVSPEGREYTFHNQAEFAKRHNLGLSSLSALLSGGITHHKHWYTSLTAYNNAKKELISPTGIIYSFFTIAAFARAHGLEPSALSRVLGGKMKSHKGWTKPL